MKTDPSTDTDVFDLDCNKNDPSGFLVSEDDDDIFDSPAGTVQPMAPTISLSDGSNTLPPPRLWIFRTCINVQPLGLAVTVTETTWSCYNGMIYPLARC